MGALGLEGWGRRPQGKGCLLLAVAGAASLVTLLLAVPITVLAVLVVAPPKPGLGDGAGGRLGPQWEVGLASAGLTSGHCDPPAPSRWQSPLTPGHKHRPSSDWVRADRLPSRSSSRDSSPPSICTPPPPTLCSSSGDAGPRPGTRRGGRPAPILGSSPLPGPQELPEQDAETDPSPGPPAAHLIGKGLVDLPGPAPARPPGAPGGGAPRGWGMGDGTREPRSLRRRAWTQGGGLGWEAAKEEAFVRSGAQFGAAGLALPRDGLYYLYCHSRLYRAGGAYGRGAPELLLEGAETVRPAPDAAGRLWYASVGFGGLARLRRGERVFVNISHPDLVDARRGKTFFGAVMVG
ncbi:hypothetical protein QTO34_013028 [Cnephaeus nilssonii]|uniref:THD domain-containing protein n=1 Tax=Cnephaeus nilssonii TaxID=3371016 RepID=A0AA40LBY5_CNENI|nr:hypothetical protein QTO34_013028 [Eptesicus nilssonii]